MHELGHWRRSHGRNPDPPLYYSQRVEEEAADRFAMETFVHRSGLGSTRLFVEVVNLAEGPLLTGLTQLGARSPVQITATHPAMLIRVSNLYDDVLDTRTLEPADRELLGKLRDEFLVLGDNLTRWHYATILLPPGEIAETALTCGSDIWILSASSKLYRVIGFMLYHDPFGLPSSVNAMRYGDGTDPFLTELRCSFGQVISVSRNDGTTTCLARCNVRTTENGPRVQSGLNAEWDPASRTISLGGRKASGTLDGSVIARDGFTFEQAFVSEDAVVVIARGSGSHNIAAYTGSLRGTDPTLKQVLTVQPPENVAPAVATDDGRYVFLSSRADFLPIGIRIADGTVVPSHGSLSRGWDSFEKLTMLRFPGVVVAAVATRSGHPVFFDKYMNSSEIAFAIAANDVVIGVPASRVLFVFGSRPNLLPY